MARQFETAAGEFDAGCPPVLYGGLPGAHPLRFDLQADDADIGPHPAQPHRQLQCGHGFRAVTEIDDHGIGEACRAVRTREECTSQRSLRRSRLWPVVPRVT